MIRRSVLCGLLLALAAQVSPRPLAASEPERAPFEEFHPVAAAEAGVSILPPATAGAAAALEWQASCNPEKRRAAVVSLAWQSASAAGAGASRVDISKFRDGFATGRYQVSRHLPRSMAALSIDAPEPGLNYYWRVLTETPNGWVTSPVERFEVPICPWDGEERQEPEGGEEPPGRTSELQEGGGR